MTCNRKQQARKMGNTSGQNMKEAVKTVII